MLDSQTNEQPDSESTTLDPPDPAQRFGAAAAEDAELADEVTRDADGDMEAAKSRFEKEQQGPAPTGTASSSDD